MWSKPFKLRTSNLFGIQLLKSFQHWPCFLWDLDTTQHLCIPPVVPNMTFRNSHSVFIPSKNVVACEETPILKLVQKHCHYHWPRDLENFFSCFKLRDGKKKTGLPSKSIVHIFIPKMSICFEQKTIKIKKRVPFPHFLTLFHTWHLWNSTWKPPKIWPTITIEVHTQLLLVRRITTDNWDLIFGCVKACQNRRGTVNLSSGKHQECTFNLCKERFDTCMMETTNK